MASEMYNLLKVNIGISDVIPINQPYNEPLFTNENCLIIFFLSGLCSNYYIFLQGFISVNNIKIYDRMI